MLAKAASAALADEETQRKLGWTLAAVLSPVILLIAFFCALGFGADGFCSPVGENWRNIVTSEFGNRIDPITSQRDGHSGIDLAVPTGTSIRAALPGTVTAAKYHYSYGYYVMIAHGNGLATLYAHNSQLLVRAGQTVEAGDVISLSGSTGRVTGPHLHFEVRINGSRTNPRGYLPYRANARGETAEHK